MRVFYFFIFLLILLSSAVGLFYFFQQSLSVLQAANSAKLQASILVSQLAENNSKNSNEETATLVFVGDIMLDRGVEKVFEKYDNSRYPFLKVVDEIRSADIAFANLEGPISEAGQNFKLKYSFRFNPEVISGLKFAGFDVLSLANNHIMDWGRQALEDTVNILKRNGIEPVGAGINYLEANSPVIFNLRTSDVKIAFLAYELLNQNAEWLKAGKDFAGRSDFELERVKNDISLIKTLKIADVVIISFHWGEEYQLRSNKKQQEIGRALVEAGADLIVGHHPHVVQEIERYKNGWIAYSLGNFIFDQNFSEETMKGLMIKAKIHDKKIIDIEPIEIKINSSFQPEPTGL